MNKNQSLGLFTLLSVALLGLVWWHTGRLAPPSGGDSIWFHAGLFTLLLGRFITEYRFTKPNDVFLNCVVVFVSTSTLTNPPYEEWWQLIRWGSLVVGAGALWLAWDPGREARLSKSWARTMAYGVVTQLGRAEVIFSMVFVLALISYFDWQSLEAKVFAVAWGTILIAANLNIPSTTRAALRTGRSQNVLGTVHSFAAPTIVFCRRLGNQKVSLHQIVGFTQGIGRPCHCLGMVIGERSSTSETRIAVALLHCSIGNSELNERSLMVTVSDTERQAFVPPVLDEDVDRLKKIAGTVVKGTTISQLKFELFGAPNVTAGVLLRAGSSDPAVFYQVFDGVIDEERTIQESTRAFVEGDAEQVGFWDAGRGGFETHDWVAKERAPVFMIDEADAAPNYELGPTEISIGTVPRSSYPVNIDLHELVLYHSAVLGVTGSGKSFFTFGVIDECVQKGIKVVCLDPTGDYQRYLNTAVILPDRDAVDVFLDGEDHMIGIVETASIKSPIEQAQRISQRCLDWCKRNRAPGDVLTPKPKVMVVFEEAHLLVPEWNFNPIPAQQNLVNITAQVVLQARKYGLGFLVVSQRTANVTKSILNQCNTIVSFQAFDETGFEFLKNYMGPYHVRSLPNLKPRHGILVGKASRSRRPLMVRFSEQGRELRHEPAPNIEVPDTPERGPVTPL